MLRACIRRVFLSQSFIRGALLGSIPKTPFTYVLFCNTLIYMNIKRNLKTIRLAPDEEKTINRFLKEHPYIRSFSTLVRAAIWDFLNRNREILERREEIPSFLWEYDLGYGQIVEILRGPQKNRLWLVAKILEHGRWEEIWEYLTLDMIRRDLSLLRLPKKTKEHWEYALRRWRREA